MAIDVGFARKRTLRLSASRGAASIADNVRTDQEQGAGDGERLERSPILLSRNAMVVPILITAPLDDDKSKRKEFEKLFVEKVRDSRSNGYAPEHFDQDMQFYPTYDPPRQPLAPSQLFCVLQQQLQLFPVGDIGVENTGEDADEGDKDENEERFAQRLSEYQDHRAPFYSSPCPPSRSGNESQDWSIANVAIVADDLSAQTAIVFIVENLKRDAGSANKYAAEFLGKQRTWCMGYGVGAVRCTADSLDSVIPSLLVSTLEIEHFSDIAIDNSSVYTSVQPK